MTIVKPSVASRPATAAPMPRDAPVTIATLLVLSVILQSPIVIGGNAYRREKDSYFRRALTALRSGLGVGLAPTAGRGDAFAGQPRGVVGREENRHARDVFGLAETAQWRHADNLLFEIAAKDAGRNKSLRCGTSGRDGVDANLARAQFLRQAARDRVDRVFGCGRDHRVRRRVQACDR